MSNLPNAIVMIAGAVTLLWGLLGTSPPLPGFVACMMGGGMFMFGLMTWER